MKIIGSVKEDLSFEKRISITPENVKKFTSDGNIVKTIYVPNRLLNFVVQ